MGELGSDANWNRLLEFVPNAKRIENVKGIYNVHKACAEQSTTDNFWVVDADAWIVDGFSFDWEPTAEVKYWNVPETECVVIWPSYNPVNELVYGYGAVKVFPRKPFLEDCGWSIDMSSSIVKVVVSKDTVSCETRFNATPESAWIGAFRECAKLSSLSMVKTRIRKSIAAEQKSLEEVEAYIKSQSWDNNKKANYRRTQTLLIQERYKDEQNIFKYWEEIETYSQRRLTWCTHGWHKTNGKYSLLGAQAGSKFGLENSDNLDALNLINDWDWLKKEFKNVNV
jgi:hypothetical protein